jgi:hypothetical protein
MAIKDQYLRLTIPSRSSITPALDAIRSVNIVNHYVPASMTLTDHPVISAKGRVDTG